MRSILAGTALAVTTGILAASPALANLEQVQAVAAQPEQKQCIAQTIYHEARGEPEKAQRAVAAVVLNRAADPAFPDTPCDVVRQGGEDPPCQFSWWCDGRSDAPSESDAWIRALTIADEMVENPELDPTNGATFFHHVRVNPKWRYVFDHVATIGEHAFYQDPAAADPSPEGRGGDQVAQRP